jgi:zinc/manganese transport system substrate-binding protein
VGPDGDAHEYEPTPQDSVAIAEAKLIFENGLAFETWLDDLYIASGSEAKRIIVSDGIEIKTLEHGEVDPHIWHNPQNVMLIIDTIAMALSEADPDNKDFYLQNAAAYKIKLEQLEQDLQAEVNKLPVERRKLITSHDALGYLADHYGFEIIGTVISSVTTESSDANAGELADLIDTIKEAGVPAIFVENITSTDLIQQVATSAGVTIAPALYTDALGQEDTQGATYLGMMRYNIVTLVDALSQ